MLPAATGFNNLFIWRSDADGGDPSTVDIGSVVGLVSRVLFGAAVARTYDGVAGQLIVTILRQNAGLLSGETVEVT